MTAKKNTFYFSHDSNARGDDKCLLLIDALGLEGYGAYWILIEILREQPDYTYPLKLIPAIAKRYYTTAEIMLSVINDFELFKVDDSNKFYSESLNRRMAFVEAKIEQTKQAAQKSAEVRKARQQQRYEAPPEQPQPEKPKPPQKKQNNKIDELFEAFWFAYPRHEKRKNALAAYTKLNPNEELHNKIIAQINYFKQYHRDWIEGFIPHPTTFLNGKRWEDEIPPEKRITKGKVKNNIQNLEDNHDYKELEKKWLNKYTTPEEEETPEETSEEFKERMRKIRNAE
jgi:hypothetical protein